MARSVVGILLLCLAVAACQPAPTLPVSPPAAAPAVAATASPVPATSTPVALPPTSTAPAPSPTVAPTTVAATPTATTRAAARPTPTSNVIVDAPTAGQEITSPVRVSGQARAFEAMLDVELIVDDVSLGRLPVHASVGAPEWGEYSADLSFESPATPIDATLRAFTLSAKDGSVRDLVEVPVRLRAVAASPTPASATTTKLLVYFPREAPDELLFVGVTREVPKTQSIGRAALDELLRGPTPAEHAQQLYAPFPADATVKSLRIENGTATVDYSANVGIGGGAARARAIIRSTELTLRQFSTVQKVVILIDGKPAALEP
jgi:hypothetical protein